MAVPAAAQAGLSTMFPVTAIAGIFGSTQEKRAAAEAMRILNQARIDASNQAQSLEKLYTPLVQGGQAGIDQARSLLTDYLTQTQNLDVGNGLSGADTQSFSDASRLLKEQMVGTGNLRSGAAAYSQAQLMSRVVANAQERRFNRDVAKMNLLFGGAATIGNQGINEVLVGTKGMEQATSLRNSILGFSTNLAGTELTKGSALSNQIMSAGRATDELWHTGLAAANYMSTPTPTP